MERLTRWRKIIRKPDIFSCLSLDMKQQREQEKAIRTFRKQIEKHDCILGSKGERALEEYKRKESKRLTELAEKRQAAFLKKIGSPWYEKIDPERRNTVYDYWLELIRFSRHEKEAEFKAFLETGKRILEKIEGRVDVHYVLWQLAQIAWGEFKKPLGEKVADKIIKDYWFINWDREKLLTSMDHQSRQTITYRGIVINRAKSGIRGKGAPPDTELNEMIVCLTEHFIKRLNGPRWNTTARLLNACHINIEENYFDQEKVKKRYKYWEKRDQSTGSPIQSYQSSLKTFDSFKKDLKGFLTP
jgi:hypothetical protein